MPEGPPYENCTGTLTPVETEISRQYGQYLYHECDSCPQIVLVAPEYFAENGLPPEHSPAVG